MIERYHFGREFQSKTKFNIRNQTWITKGYLAVLLALAFTRVFAISLFLVDRRLSDMWPSSTAI